MAWVIGAGIGLGVAATVVLVADVRLALRGWRKMRLPLPAEPLYCEFCGPDAAACCVCGRGADSGILASENPAA